jgi:peptide/nickel transport system permease protein
MSLVVSRSASRQNTREISLTVRDMRKDTREISLTVRDMRISFCNNNSVSQMGRQHMISLIRRRLAASVVVILGALTVIFIVVRIVPGDPAALILGANATQQEIDQVRANLGLNEPLIKQYGQFMLHALRFDFGTSYRLEGHAMNRVLDALPVTLALAATSIVLVLIVSTIAGVAAARRPGTVRDRIISGGAMILQSLPEFWIGMLLIMVVSGTWHLLPSGGYGTPQHFILPTVTMTVSFLGMLTRMVRNSSLEQANEGFVQTARAKGMGETRLFYVHILRNGLLPVVTLAGLVLGVFLGNAVVVETVFSWPGVGRLLIQSILNRDYPVVEASVFIFAIFYVVLNLGVDLLYGLIDPRVRVAVAA